MSWNCYILRSLDPEHQNSTYVGMTNNLPRRLRQHNGEISGGAKSTHKNRPYEMYCIVSGFRTKGEALSYEWRIKHPEGNKRRNQYRGVLGRIKALLYVLINWPPTYEISLKVPEEYKYLLELE